MNKFKKSLLTFLLIGTSVGVVSGSCINSLQYALASISVQHAQYAAFCSTFDLVLAVPCHLNNEIAYQIAYNYEIEHYNICCNSEPGCI